MKPWRLAIAAMFSPVLAACGLFREPVLFQAQFDGLIPVCALAGARFEEGSLLFGTASVVDLRGLPDQERKTACIMARPEFRGQPFTIRRDS